MMVKKAETCKRFAVMVLCIYGDRGSTVVKVMCYKSEGRCFDPTTMTSSVAPDGSWKIGITGPN